VKTDAYAARERGGWLNGADTHAAPAAAFFQTPRFGGQQDAAAARAVRMVTEGLMKGGDPRGNGYFRSSS
jgi:hypothetical protein